MFKLLWCFPGGTVVKNRNGNPLQYSCMENPMDRGAWRAIIHGITKSQTQLTEHTHAYTHILLIQEKAEVREVVTVQDRAR